MIKTLKNISSEYFALSKLIDKHVGELENIHQNHLKCKNGCDSCCMNYSIFPVEYYSILEKLKNEPADWIQKIPENGKCIFLNNHSCDIYEHRPIICRTHGLPLLYANNEGEWELSACELNFTEYNFEDFTAENTFPQDTYNSKLFMLNQQFIENFSAKKFNRFDLIPLSQLQNDLKNQ